MKKEFNDRETAEKQKQVEKDEFNRKWGSRLNTWANDAGKTETHLNFLLMIDRRLCAGNKRKAIRSLLSTMHTVLWKGARWNELNMSKLLQPKQVKIAYRRAMLVVHPDKVAKGTNVQIFIAEKIFDALQDAYGTFEKNEMS